MLELIHVSDLHFGKSRKQNKRALRLLGKIQTQFDFSGEQQRYLLVTGDSTHHGRRGEYQLAAQALAPFTGRIFLTPGNHDYGSLGGTIFSRRKARYFDVPFAARLGFHHPFLPKRVFTQLLTSGSGQNRLLMIGLNSCTFKDLEDFSRGKIGSAQRAELTQVLQTSDPQIPKLVFLHHIPDREAVWQTIMSLEDWEDLMAIVSGKIEMMAFGHQGKFRDSARQEALKPAPGRPLEVRALADARSRSSICMLDANESTGEQACYRIYFDAGGQLVAEKQALV